MNRDHIDNYNINKEVDEMKKITTFTELDYRIDQQEVLVAINKLKAGKAAGNDQIINEMLIHGREILLEPLVRIFNMIYSLGIFPRSWGECIVKPLFKGGSPYDANQYRGISLTSCLGKLFCSVLNMRFVKYVDSQIGQSRSQIAHKKGQRTTDHVFVLDTLIKKYIKRVQGQSNTKNFLYVAFVDFQKAFDSVWREGLYFKLLKAGINGHFLKIVEDMYSKYCMVVKLTDGYSEKIPTNTGVKQGCVISPMLFNFYINDLPEYIEHSGGTDPVQLEITKLNCLLFADDLVLISESASGLQTCLDNLQKYCEKWHLNINSTKTKIMIFNKSGALIKRFNFYIGGERLEVMRNYKYHGINFDITGSNINMSKNLKDKALKAVFKVYKAFGGKPSQVKIAMHLFNSVIKPILLYGNEIWGAGLHDFSKLLTCHIGKTSMYWNTVVQRFHSKWCKRILNVNDRASNMATLAELGEYPIALEICYNIIKYWVRTIQFDENSLTFECYRENMMLSQQGNPCWIKAVKDILCAIGMEEIWYNQNLIGIRESNFLRNVRSKLNDVYKMQWTLDMYDDDRKNKESKNKLRTYRTFKNVYSFEKYLHMNDVDGRTNIVRFRISAHNLNVEKMRHSNVYIPVGHRICTMCNENAVEDEFHVLMNCNAYSIIRQEYAKKFDIPNLDQMVVSENKKELFVKIMKCEDEKYMRFISMFLKGVKEGRGSL